MAYGKHVVVELLNRTSIVRVIGEFLHLRKRLGNPNEYVARCPFHTERTPSFTVNEAKQFYHCFGCGATGNALRFVMEHQGVDFISAVKVVARISKFRLPNGPPPSRKKMSDRAKRRKKVAYVNRKKERSALSEEKFQYVY